MTKYTSFAPEFDGDVLACRCRKEIRGHIKGCRLNEFGFGAGLRLGGCCFDSLEVRNVADAIFAELRYIAWMDQAPESNKLDPRNWVQKYGDIFYSYAIRRLNDSQAAEDVVQETFLAAIKSSGSFRGDSLESTWLSSILRKKTIDVIRKRERRRKSQPVSDGVEVNDFSEEQCLQVIGASFSMTPSKAMTDAEFMELVDESLARLPKNQASVFVLRELEQLEPEAICELLCISRKNLWVRLFRARVALAKSISGKLATDDSVREARIVYTEGDGG